MEQDPHQALHDWLETQHAFWQSLLSDQEKAPADWEVLFEACRHQAESSAAPLNAELIEAMARQVRDFCRCGERLLRALKDPQTLPELEDAIQAFNDHLIEQADAEIMKHWQLPAQFAQLLSQLGILPDKGFPFDLPGHPPLPHWRERLQAAQQHYQRYRDALQDYIDSLRRISRRTRARMAEALAQAPPQSLVDLHRLWVDCYEACYREQLQTEAYQASYGRLSNAALELQRLARTYWEPEYRALGLVPRKDYDQLLHNHHQLRKRQRQTEQALADLERRLQVAEQAQREQQALLARQLEAQRASPASPPTRAPKDQ